MDVNYPYIKHENLGAVNFELTCVDSMLRALLEKLRSESA